MLSGFYFSEDRFENAVRTDHKSGALRAHVGFTVHAFLHPDPVSLDDFLGGVAQECEGQLELIDELAMAFFRVNADDPILRRSEEFRQG